MQQLAGLYELASKQQNLLIICIHKIFDITLLNRSEA